jgi:hypothetical protein
MGYIVVIISFSLTVNTVSNTDKVCFSLRTRRLWGCIIYTCWYHNSVFTNWQVLWLRMIVVMKYVSQIFRIASHMTFVQKSFDMERSTEYRRLLHSSQISESTLPQYRKYEYCVTNNELFELGPLCAYVCVSVCLCVCVCVCVCVYVVRLCVCNLWSVNNLCARRWWNVEEARVWKFRLPFLTDSQSSVPHVTTMATNCGNLVRFPKDILPNVVIPVFLNGQHVRVLHGIYCWQSLLKKVNVK